MIDYDNNHEISRVWLIFPNPEKIGRKIRSKVLGYISNHNITSNAVPIAGRSCAIPFNNNKNINAKRNHFPVVSACAITIHKSQGASFDEVVYEYEKTHSQQLVYVALSRATRVEGLYIVTENPIKNSSTAEKNLYLSVIYKMNLKGYRSIDFKQSLMS